MKITADYHTHTIYSHGKGTILDNVEVARRKGLKKIVISDHGTGHITYGIKRDKLEKMRHEIDALNKKYDDIEIKLGVEANIIGTDGTIDVSEDEMKYFDYIYAGFHYGFLPTNLKDFFKFYILNFLIKILPLLESKAKEINTTAVINAFDRYPIKILTHPGAKIPIDIDKVAMAAEKKGVWLEINSSHGHLTVDEINIAKEHNVKFVINSDAHQPEKVGSVLSGIERAKATGLTEKDIVNI